MFKKQEKKLENKPDREIIDGFKNKYDFLSNFHKCKVEFEGITYPSSEHAYQASKTENFKAKKIIAKTLEAWETKIICNEFKYGQTVGYQRQKITIMYNIVRAKFSQNASIRSQLVNTGSALLIEGNTWNDTYWGQCGNLGQNHLGKILMQIRNLFRESD